MMSNAVLQVLQIFAYLAIGLISITFPIYAICVTYLQQEKRETKKERKKRIEKLKEHITKLTKELSGNPRDSERFKEMQRRIKRCENELESLELRVGHLTAVGAVLLPVIFLIIALTQACIGIYFFYEGAEFWVGFFISGYIAFSGGALYFLYKTLSAVEYAALRPARTVEFEVVYGSGKKSKEIKLGKQTELIIAACTSDEDLECFEIDVFIPPEIEVKKMLTTDSYFSNQPAGSDRPNYLMITREKNFCAKDTALGLQFIVSARKTGKYMIYVGLSAKGIYPFNDELILNVVK